MPHWSDWPKRAGYQEFRLEQVPGKVMESGDHDANYPAGAPTRPVFWDSQYGIGYEGGSSQFHPDTINEHPELRERFGNGDFDIFNPPKGMYMGRKIMFTK